MDENEEELQESGVRVSSRSKIASKRLDQEEVFFERLTGLRTKDRDIFLRSPQGGRISKPC